MTDVRSYLALKRLVVMQGDHVAYDHSFHQGLNIIRGSNSSGKSTILDFIFYALGGEVVVWKTAASKCTSVIAEVEINKTTLTLQREVAEQSKRPMAVYYGPLEQSSKHRFTNWMQYPYSAQGEHESFSKVLFRTLAFPEVKSDLDSNITMHQLLRLAYVDQISRTTSLMREEDWDSPLIRKTIAEMMFGVYDDTLYADELNLRTRQRELEDISLQIVNALDVLEEVGEEIDSEKIEAQIGEVGKAVEQINQDIENIINDTTVIRDTSQTETEALRKEITKLKQALADTAEALNSVTLEIVDSAQFLESLRGRLAALEDSLATRDALGPLPHCPLCAIPIKAVEGKPTCELSGREIEGDFGRASMSKMRDEVRFQIAESEGLQRKREQKREALSTEGVHLKAEVQRASRTYQQMIKAVKSARDNRLDELYRQKGQLEAKLEYSERLTRYSNVLKNLRTREVQLKKFVAELEASITDKRRRQAGRWTEATAEVQTAASIIVQQDLPRQEEFAAVDSIELDFTRNTYRLNDKSNFSASSNAVLKNAVHFGVLFASTEDVEFRYPRFLICDNVEDGGMEEDRSKNFQRVIADCATRATQPFQIIFSTSMIDPSLDNENFCVGPKYTKERKSLRLTSASD